MVNIVKRYKTISNSRFRKNWSFSSWCFQGLSRIAKYR